MKRCWRDRASRALQLAACSATASFAHAQSRVHAARAVRRARQRHTIMATSSSCSSPAPPRRPRARAMGRVGDISLRPRSSAHLPRGVLALRWLRSACPRDRCVCAGRSRLACGPRPTRRGDLFTQVLLERIEPALGIDRPPISPNIPRPGGLARLKPATRVSPSGSSCTPRASSWRTDSRAVRFARAAPAVRKEQELRGGSDGRVFPLDEKFLPPSIASARREGLRRFDGC